MGTNTKRTKFVKTGEIAENGNEIARLEPIEEITVNDEGFIYGEYNGSEQPEEAHMQKVTRETKKERTPNTIYTLKAFKAYLTKLEKQKMVTKEEMDQLTKIHEAMVKRWIGLTL